MKSSTYPVNAREFYGTPWPVLILSSLALSALLIFSHNAFFGNASQWTTSHRNTNWADENRTPSQKPEAAAIVLPVVQPETPKTDSVQTTVAFDSSSALSDNAPVMPEKLDNQNKKLVYNTLSVSDRKFIKENDIRNDSIVQILSSTIDMYSFHFSYRHTAPDQDSMERSKDSLLNLYATGAKKFSKIVVLGFTDNRGPKLANIKMGATRAEYIKDKLVRMGISADKIVTASFGSKLPIDTNTTETGRAKNRRVEVNIQDS
jgi:outer membrane protein OmpA-like peptidoglycan-associated protein